MNNFFALLKREFGLFWNNSVLRILFIGAPIMYAVLMGFVYKKGKVTDLPIIVVDEDHSLQGIVSRKDLLKVTLGNAQATTMPIQMLMTRQPKIYTATPEESVWEAARKLIYYEIDSLPVIKKVEENDTVTMKVVGRITKTNIIKALLDLENEEI